MQLLHLSQEKHLDLPYVEAILISEGRTTQNTGLPPKMMAQL